MYEGSNSNKSQSFDSKEHFTKNKLEIKWHQSYIKYNVSE